MVKLTWIADWSRLEKELNFTTLYLNESWKENKAERNFIIYRLCFSFGEWFFEINLLSFVSLISLKLIFFIRGSRFLLLWFLKYIILIWFLNLRIRQQIWNKGKYSWNIKAKGKENYWTGNDLALQPYWLQDMWLVCGKILICWKIQVSSNRHLEKLCVRRDSIG